MANTLGPGQKQLQSTSCKLVQGVPWSRFEWGAFKYKWKAYISQTWLVEYFSQTLIFIQHK